MTIQDWIAFWREHGTKILGVLVTFVATALLIPDLIPEQQMKYWLFANALLGGGAVRRGFTNTATGDASKQAGFARPLMLAFLLAIAVPVVAMLPACTTLGLTPASSFSQRLAYGYGSHTAVLTAAKRSLEAGDIDADDAQRVLTVADQARTALDAARLASAAGDPATAEGRLQLAVSLLSELQNYLRTHQ